VNLDIDWLLCLCLIFILNVLQSCYPFWEDMVAKAAKLHASLRYSRPF